MLNKNNVETRSILSRNFMNQESIELYNLNPKKKTYPNSQGIEDREFFIGLHAKPITNSELQKLIKQLLLIEEI